MILAYEIPPVRPIQVDELARQLSVSRTPVREALYRLRGEGLVDSSPNAGFFIPDLTEEGIRAVFKYRMAIESAAAYQAARRSPPDLLKGFLGWWQHSSAGLTQAGIERRVAHNETFARRLGELAGSPMLVESIDRVNDRIRFFRTITLQAAVEIQVACEVQHTLLRAIEGRRALACFRIAKQHVERRLRQIPDLMREAIMQIYLRRNHRTGMAASPD